MDDVILLIGHGSRERQGNEEIEKFALQWRHARPDLHIDVCYIEFAEVLLHQGLQQAARRARKVVVIPLILNAAGHVKMEIPAAVAAARLEFPHVDFTLMPHLGANDHILSILKRRLQQAMAELDHPDPQTTSIVLLGRGSSDRQANGEVAKMARWLQESSKHEIMDIAFTGITWPRLEKVVQQQIRLGAMQVVVLPYYLFTGKLIQRIDRQVENLKQQYPHQRIIAMKYFGFEAEIFELLNQRVAHARNGDSRNALPCDGCKYRELAEEHGHQHHHHSHPLQESIRV